MIETLVVAAGALAALVYVLAPLRRGPIEEVADPAHRLDEIEARKHAALAAIVDLEAEKEVGKLTANDLAPLRAQYEAEAVAALHELDALETEVAGSDDAALEAAIARARAEFTCPTCGALRTEAGCARCGTS